MDTDHKITMDLEWKAPEQTFGALKGYREGDTVHTVHVQLFVDIVHYRILQYNKVHYK